MEALRSKVTVVIKLLERKMSNKIQENPVSMFIWGPEKTDAAAVRVGIGSVSSSSEKFPLRICFRVLEFPSLQADSKVVRFARIVFNVDEGIFIIRVMPMRFMLGFSSNRLNDLKFLSSCNLAPFFLSPF
ncbi:hypothetical protein T4B_13854 [Trichinella pseudospiralis]|uniref:Uncharacterized protein n=1 Tax=Trichinella pseudospiralis TaxID=6337 RepID=A0A0V1IBJ9_TRIPS|nr:hypothetical protein T4B_13854 [Trichinella pseudospiralis]